MNFYALDEVALNGNLNNLGSGQIAINVTSNGYATGDAGVASVSIAISVTGDLMQAPPGGMASIKVRGFACGHKARLGITSAEIITTGDANLRESVRDFGYGEIAVYASGSIHRTHLHFGYISRNKFVVLARGNACLRHLKRNQAQASIALSGTTVITASIPEQPEVTHPSRYVALPVESRVMIVPPEKEQRGAYAAYSYVR
ncbi:hypothetical protein BKM35_22160 [Salmonella enterica]|nr:hypothetical protein [Salmonella enterica]